MEEIKGEGEGGNGQMRQGGSLEHPRGGRFREKGCECKISFGFKDLLAIRFLESCLSSPSMQIGQIILTDYKVFKETSRKPGI